VVEFFCISSCAKAAVLPEAVALQRRRPGVVLICLAVLAAAVVVAFLTVGARGRWDFVLAFRGTKLAAIVLVGVGVATAAVMFQTIVQNRILTPSIMGFDALYSLIQTSVVFFIGARGLGFGDPRLAFAIDVCAMIGFALLLYGGLLADGRRSLHMMLLVGVVMAALFRSCASFMERVIDPNDFVVLQDRLFANFNTVRSELLLPAALVVLVVLVAAWRLLPRLDVMLLGRDAAIGLGVDHRRLVIQVLTLVAILTSVSTALVGPITFLGLLVANFAYVIVPGFRHIHVVPAAALIAIITLGGGQLVLERVFALNAALPMVIEFTGGVVLIALLIRSSRR
jgi:iron complex transport system permease protein